ATDAGGRRPDHLRIMGDVRPIAGPADIGEDAWNEVLSLADPAPDHLLRTPSAWRAQQIFANQISIVPRGVDELPVASHFLSIEVRSERQLTVPHERRRSDLCAREIVRAVDVHHPQVV